MPKFCLDLTLAYVFFFLLAACAPTKAKTDSPPALPPASEEIRTLGFGTSFLNAPRTYVSFKNLSPGGSLQQKVVFTAPYAGTLTLARETIGVGTACSSSKNGEKEYDLLYSFHLYDLQKKSFSKPAEDQSRSTLQNKFVLAANDQLLIHVDLTSYVHCTSADFGLAATFH